MCVCVVCVCVCVCEKNHKAGEIAADTLQGPWCVSICLYPHCSPLFLSVCGVCVCVCVCVCVSVCVCVCVGDSI